MAVGDCTAYGGGGDTSDSREARKEPEEEFLRAILRHSGHLR